MSGRPSGIEKVFFLDTAYMSSFKFILYMLLFGD
jgi:hypothetical protein